MYYIYYVVKQLLSYFPKLQPINILQKSLLMSFESGKVKSAPPPPSLVTCIHYNQFSETVGQGATHHQFHQKRYKAITYVMNFLTRYTL